MVTFVNSATKFDLVAMVTISTMFTVVPVLTLATMVAFVTKLTMNTLADTPNGMQPPSLGRAASGLGHDR